MSSVDSSCGWSWSSFQIFYWSMKVKPFMYQSIWLRERSWNFAVGELKHFLFACKQTFVLILLDNIPNVVLCHAQSSEASQWWGFGKNYPNTKTTHHRGDTKTKASSVWNKILAWEYTSCKACWGSQHCRAEGGSVLLNWCPWAALQLAVEQSISMLLNSCAPK